MVDSLPSVRIPSGPITKHGAWSVLKGDKPLMWLVSPDGSVLVNLMGGVARANPMRPESVQLKELKALGASWKVIRQKGATQDGETFIDALYDAAEPTMKVIVRGRDAEHTRRVKQAFEGSLDAIQQSELNFYTKELGRWWADIRMLKAIPDALSASPTSQELSIMLGIDNAFWQSEPHVTSFGFVYEDMLDEFSTPHSTDLGPNWPIYYYDASGTAGGFILSDGNQAVWVDDPADMFFTQGRSVMFGPYKDFETATNNQVVSITFGSFQEIGVGDGAENHIWARCGHDVDGNWDGNGVRASIGPFSVELSRYNDFVETRMMLWPNLPSFPGDTYTLIAGFEGNERQFQIQRNGLAIWNYVEPATGLSPLGASYRGVGGGMRGGAALITQVTPACILRISAGDNATVSQSGYVDFVNNGDQPGYWDALITGPASEVKIWNGPDADVNDYISIRNILPNQMFYIRTDPRDRIVEDITKGNATPEEAALYQQVRDKFTSFSAQQGQAASVFGVVSPQGPVESLVKGRFSTSCAIPAKSPGKPVQKHHVKVSIDGGNAQSQIIASLTPRRRSPI